MEELLACRVCLITDVKLFDMYKNNLAESFEMLTGSRVSLKGLPRYICSICAALLLKSVTFKKKCDIAHNILTWTLKQHRRLTTARLRSIDRSLDSLDYPLTIETVKENYFINEVEVPYPMKEEYLDDSDFEDKDINTYEVPWKYESNNYSAVIKKNEALEDSVESENSTDDVEEEQQIGEVLYESDEEPLTKIKEKEESREAKNNTKNAVVVLSKDHRIEGMLLNHVKTLKPNKDPITPESDKEPLPKVKEKEIALEESRQAKNNTKDVMVVLSKDHQIEGMLLNHVNNLNPVKETITPESDEEVMTEEQLRDSNVDVMVVVFSREQQIERVLSRKNSANYLNSPYKCDKCYKGFLTNWSFENHMVKHDPVRGPHECYACCTRWASRAALAEHVTSTHERQYVCLKCDHVSGTSHQANEHDRWHRGVTYTCNICGATFNKPTSQLSHMRAKHPASVRCELCGDCFHGPRGVALHTLLVHAHQSSGVRSVDLPAEETDIALCGRCGVQFRSADALERHASEAGEDSCDSLRPCVRCGAGLASDAALAAHSRTHDTDQPTVKCQECAATLPAGRAHAAHRRRAHRRLRDHVCELCGTLCRSAAALVYHQRTHTGEKPYPCRECPKRFRVSDQLKIHARTHSGERPYKCARCPKAFKAHAALNRHELVHSGKKPYTCSYCGRAFSQSNSMKGHVAAVHRGEPPRARPVADKTK